MKRKYHTPACAEGIKTSGKETKPSKQKLQRRWETFASNIQRKTTLWAVLLFAARFEPRCWGGGIACTLNWGIAGWAAATVNLLDVQQLVSQQHKRRRCRCDWTARGAKTVLFPPDFHYIHNRLLQKQHLWITFKTFYYCSFFLEHLMLL